MLACNNCSGTELEAEAGLAEPAIVELYSLTSRVLKLEEGQRRLEAALRGRGPAADGTRPARRRGQVQSLDDCDFSIFADPNSIEEVPLVEAPDDDVHSKCKALQVQVEALSRQLDEMRQTQSSLRDQVTMNLHTATPNHPGPSCDKHVSNSEVLLEVAGLVAPTNAGVAGTCKTSVVCKPEAKSAQDDIRSVTSAPLRDAYVFKESIWDAAIFLGTSRMGVVVSMYVAWLTFVNIFVQVFFCIIVLNNFTSPTFDSESVLGFKLWRNSIAHDMKHLSYIADSSLASRVCSGDSSLEMGGQQQDAVLQIKSYMPSPEDVQEFYVFGERQGEIMCSLALAAWCFSVVRELRDIASNFRAIAHIVVRDSQSTTFVPAVDGGGLVIESMCAVRAVLCCVINVLRIAIAMLLLYSGAQYLIHTVDMRELLLNAIALEFVLLIDELIYEALAPLQTKVFVKALAPISMPIHFRWHRLDLHSVIACFLAFGMLAYFVAWPLQWEVQNLAAAREALCGGNTDFVFVRSLMPNQFWWAATAAHDSEMPDTILSKDVEAIIREENRTDLDNYKMPTLSGSAWSLDILGSWGIAEAGTVWNDNCLDLLGNDHEYPAGMLMPPELVLEYVREVVEDPAVETCADIVQYCAHDSKKGLTTRQQCPVSCGCASPLSGLTLVVPGVGCPEACSSLEGYKAEAAAVPCADRPKEDLLMDAAWRSFADGLYNMSLHYPANMQQAFGYARDMLLLHGCGAADYRTYVNLCKLAGGATKSITMWCPVTCGCQAGGMSGCPPSCESG